MRNNQSATSQWSWGFHTVWSGTDRGYAFSSAVCWSCRYGRISGPVMGTYPPRVRRDLGVGPRGNSRRALATKAPTNQQLASAVGVSIPHGKGSTRATSVFVPGLLELYIYGQISHRGIKPYPPRMRRDLDVGQEGQSRRALPERPSAKWQPAGGIVVTRTCGAVSTLWISLFFPGLLDL